MDISQLSFDSTIKYLIEEEYLYTTPVVSKNTFKLINILNDNSLAEFYNQYDVVIEEKPNNNIDEKYNNNNTDEKSNNNIDEKSNNNIDEKYNNNIDEKSNNNTDEKYNNNTDEKYNNTEPNNNIEQLNSLINNVIAYIQYGYVAMSLYDNNNKNITNNYFNNYNNFVNTIVPSGNKKTNYWYKKQGIINYCSICDSNNIFQKCDQCYSKYCKYCINHSKYIKCYCGCGLIIYCDNCKYNGINNIKKCLCNKYYFSKHYCKICKM